MNKHIIFLLPCAVVILILSCAKGSHELRTVGKIYFNESDNKIVMHTLCDNKYEVVQVFKDNSASLNQVMSIGSSNKGDKITFVVNNHRNKQIFNLLRMDLARGSTDTLLHNTNQEIDYPAISPDDTVIAVLAVGDFKERHYWFLPKNIYKSELPDARLMIVSVKSKASTYINTPPLSLSKPSWSADGKSLWASTYDGNILQIGLDGSIGNAGYKGYCPTLSPDGRSLAYMRGRTLYIRNLSTNKVKSVASRFSKYKPREYCMTFITWSPDSKHILYQGQDFLSYITHWRSQFVIVPVDGGVPVVVRDIVAGGFAPAWVQ